jgi:hypothetical protein
MILTAHCLMISKLRLKENSALVTRYPEYAATQCCPVGKNIFRAFDLTPFSRANDYLAANSQAPIVWA